LGFRYSRNEGEDLSIGEVSQPGLRDAASYEGGEQEAVDDFAARNFKRAKAWALPQKGRMNITKNLGMLLLAIYLILAGVTLLFHITIPTIIMGILALAAGILILIGK
jgi:hypothetical protein